jgi:hypothetical protein
VETLKTKSILHMENVAFVFAHDGKTSIIFCMIWAHVPRESQLTELIMKKDIIKAIVGGQHQNSKQTIDGTAVQALYIMVFMQKNKALRLAEDGK